MPKEFDIHERVSAVAPVFGMRLVNLYDPNPSQATGFATQKEINAAYAAMCDSIENYGLLMEAAEFQEVDDYYNPGDVEVPREYILESLVIQKYSSIENKMHQFMYLLRKIDKGLVSEDAEAIVGKPKRNGQFAYVTVQIPLSDGQTLSIIFHAPEGDKFKAQIAPNDKFIAFRWLLNKRDITQCVAPENEEQEIPVKETLKRVAQLVRKNSAQFQKAQKTMPEEKQKLEKLQIDLENADKKQQELINKADDVLGKDSILDSEIANIQKKLAKQKAINAELQAKLDQLKIEKESKMATEDIKLAFEKSGEVLKHEVLTNDIVNNISKTVNNFKNLKKEWKSEKFDDMHRDLAHIVRKYSKEGDIRQKYFSITDCVMLLDDMTRYGIDNKTVKTILKLISEHIHELENKYPEYVNLYDNICKNKDKLKEIDIKLISQISDRVSIDSHISVEEAKEWTQKNVYFDEGIDKKLDEICYSKEELLEDVAEIYRCVGGKISAIQLIDTRKDRSFALTDSMKIAVTENFKRKYLFHECGHLVESIDSTALKCSKNFIEKRATGPAESLRNLTGDLRYKPYERAYPNHFVTPYVGKIYDNATEVLSTAFEKMSDSVSFVKLATVDPEHLNLALGFCLHNNSEITKYVQQIRDQLRTYHKKNQS